MLNYFNPVEHQSAEPLAFGQNYLERISFSSKQYKNTVYQNLNTIQPVGEGGKRIKASSPYPKYCTFAGQQHYYRPSRAR